MPRKGMSKHREPIDPAYLEGLHNRCGELGIATPAEFADKLGVSRQTGYKWYSGQSPNIAAKDLFKVADALDCNPRWLLTGLGPKAAAFRPRSENELRIINAYRVSPEERRAIVDAWLQVEEKINADKLQNDVRFNRRGKHQ